MILERKICYYQYEVGRHSPIITFTGFLKKKTKDGQTERMEKTLDE